MDHLAYLSEGLRSHIIFQFYETFPNWNINKLSIRKYNVSFCCAGSLSFWYDNSIPVVVNYADCLGFQAYWRKEENANLHDS